MLLYLQSLVFALCRLLFRGGFYGFLVLCKLLSQGRLFLFSLAGQCFDMLLNVTTIEVISVIICMVLSLWSFIIGMIRKSVPATIVTSLIVIVLRQVIITKNTTNQESIMQVILVAIVTVIATLLIFKRKVPELY